MSQNGPHDEVHTTVQRGHAGHEHHGEHEGHQRSGGHEQHGNGANGRAAGLDPVCGMTVDPATAEHRAIHDGVTYVFCSAGCWEKFLAGPDAHTGKSDDQAHHHDHHHGHDGSAATAAYADAEAEEWTCPMHPEVRRPGPGSCPICGMALEAVMASAETGPSEELRDMTRRF